MPIPRNWVEELAVEWLTIKGYLAESNVRLKAGSHGGVAEADVVGAQIIHNQLEIIHVETGSLSEGFERNIEWVKRKFEEKRQKEIVNTFEYRLEWEYGFGYRSIFVATYASKPHEMKRQLDVNKIEFLMLKDFIKQEVLLAIDTWKREQIQAGRRKTQTIKLLTLPDCYWLLNLLDYLKLSSGLNFL